MMVVEDIYEGDNEYRYILGRSPLLFLCVNPNVAKPKEPDPTISFIESNFDSWIMLNIYPQRAPTVSKLASESEFNKEKHNKNIKVIIEAIEKYCDSNIIRIVAAWGNSIDERNYLLSCLDEIVKKINTIKKKQIEWYRIGDFTKKGNPRHPQNYLQRGETNIKDILIGFDINDYISKKLR
jgi:serine/threonine protein phosphatase 1